MKAKSKLEETKANLKALREARAAMQIEQTRLGEEIESMKAKTALHEELEYDFEASQTDMLELSNEIFRADRQIVDLAAKVESLEYRSEQESYEAKLRGAFREIADIANQLHDIHERIEAIDIMHPQGIRPSNEFYMAIRGQLGHLNKLNLAAWLAEYDGSNFAFFVEDAKEAV